MTIATPNSGVFQQSLVSAVVALRNAFSAVQNLEDYITAEGGSAFLQTAFSISASDAAVITSTLGNLAALNAIYNGGTPGSALNYRSNSNLLWGGQ